MRHIRPVQYAALGIVVAVYVAIRLWNLTASCLWFDEIFGVHAAIHSWDSILSFVALDLIHPPLFYLLLKIWINLGGEGLLWLRMFPVLFSVLAVVPFIAICREFKLSIWTQIFGLFLLATNGSLIKYAQEVRMYSLMLCLSLFSMWFFARLLLKNKGLIPLVLVNILLVYSHYFGWLFVVSQIFAILIFQRRNIRQIIGMFAITVAVFAPWVFAVYQAAQTGTGISQNIGWVSRPGAVEIAKFILSLIEPVYFASSSAEPLSIYGISLPLCFIFGTGFIFYFVNMTNRGDDEQRAVKLLGFFTILPIIIAFAASWPFPYSVWGTRHLIIVFPPFLILLALAMANVKYSAARTTIISLIVLFSGYSLYQTAAKTPDEFGWCAIERLAVRSDKDVSASIYVFEDLVGYHVWNAFRGQDPVIRRIFKVTGIEGLTEDKAYFLPRGFAEITSVDAANINEPQLFIAFRDKYYDERKEPLKSFIDRGYRVKDGQFIEVKNEVAYFLELEK